ncbi:MAG: hypothetical protein JWM09_1111 [Francisellaceae bacterium]|nr:hypothetical protein [Francisellaceae bacterium]
MKTELSIKTQLLKSFLGVAFIFLVLLISYLSFDYYKEQSITQQDKHSVQRFESSLTILDEIYNVRKLTNRLFFFNINDKKDYLHYYKEQLKLIINIQKNIMLLEQEYLKNISDTFPLILTNKQYLDLKDRMIKSVYNIFESKFNSDAKVLEGLIDQFNLFNDNLLNLVKENINKEVSSLKDSKEKLQTETDLYFLIISIILMTLLLVLIIGSLKIVQKISDPLVKLSNHAQQITSEKLETFKIESEILEVNQLAHNLEKMVETFLVHEKELNNVINESVEKENKLKVILDTIGESVLIISEVGRIVIANQSFYKMLKVNSEEFTYRTARHFFRIEKNHKTLNFIQILNYIENCINQKSSSAQVWGVKKLEKYFLSK